MTDTQGRLTTALADRYRVVRELGAGGMATVFLARDLKHDRDVAIKVLHPDLGAALGAERFLAEIRITARLQHPHIVPVFDSGEADGLLYFVMPRIDGETLRQRLDREGRLPVAEALHVARELADALAHAHAHGILHRDLKPENVLLSGGHALLADFGIAASAARPAAQRLTQTGLAVGTPVYMSPEQATGERTLTPASDLYALGVLLFELLTGELPFTGATFEAILVRRLTQDAPRCATVRPDVPARVDAAIARLLARDPEARFPSAGAVASALAEAPAPPPATERAIAVLPFANLSPDAENGYFADGLTEEVILTLSKVQALRVSARTSVMQYRDRSGPLRDIAQALGVSHLLEGSVRKAGNRLRIAASLLDVAADRSVWADRFDGTLDDVFDMQDRVAQAIVGALQIALTPQEQARLVEHPIPNVAAYDAYLRAREGLNAFTLTGLERALGHLAEADRLAPGNVFVLRGMARARWAAVNNSLTSDLTLLDEALALADTIAGLEPASPFVPEIRGLVAVMRGDLDGGVRSLGTAFEATPQDLDIGFWYGAMLVFAGRVDEGLAVMNNVRRRDPQSGIAQVMPLVFETIRGNPAPLIGTLEAGPGNAPPALWYLMQGLAGLAAADHVHALRALREAEALPPDPYTAMCAFLACAVRGDAAGAAAQITPDIERVLWHDFTYTEYVAEGFALLGDLPNIVKWLGRSVSLGIGYADFLDRHCAAWRPWVDHPAVAPLMAGARANQARYATIPVPARVAALMAGRS